MVVNKDIHGFLLGSDKAEFLEHLQALLPDTDKVVVLLEVRNDTDDGSKFHWLQVGFKQLYEIQGFMDALKETITLDCEEAAEENGH